MRAKRRRGKKKGRLIRKYIVDLPVVLGEKCWVGEQGGFDEVGAFLRGEKCWQVREMPIQTLV